MGQAGKPYNIIIQVHVVFREQGENYGPGHTISDFLKKEEKRHILIKHPLYSGHATVADFFENHNVVSRFYGANRRLPMPLQVLKEIFISYKAVKENAARDSIFIGIDPLNALTGFLLLKMGHIKKLVFYTADYAVKRFENPVMNYIYHLIDRQMIRRADFIWNVSSRIVSKRKEQGVPDEINIFVPNSPDFDSVKRRPSGEDGRYNLVIMSVLNKSQNLTLIFDAISELRSSFRKINLKIIGTGEEETVLKELVKIKKLSENISFLGAKPHDEAMRILSESGVGLAIYTGEWAWNYFGDSKKVREYLACGLPVIMTGIPSTADDIMAKKAGFVINLNKEEIKNAISQLLSNEKLYLEYRENAIELAREFDSKVILKKVFEEIV